MLSLYTSSETVTLGHKLNWLRVSNSGSEILFQEDTQQFGPQVLRKHALTVKLHEEAGLG